MCIIYAYVVYAYVCACMGVHACVRAPVYVVRLARQKCVLLRRVTSKLMSRNEKKKKLSM